MYAVTALGLLVIVALGTNRWLVLHTSLYPDPLSHPCESIHATHTYKPAQRTVTADTDLVASGNTACVPYRYTLCIHNGHETKTGLDPINYSGDEHFRIFVALVTDHLLSTFANRIPRPPDTAGPPPVQLIFAKLPLFIIGDKTIPHPPTIAAPDTAASCQLRSPWVDLTFEQSPTPRLQAVLKWNERQFLRDQFHLSDQTDPPPGLPEHRWDAILVAQEANAANGEPLPLLYDDFANYAENYVEAELPPSSRLEFRQNTLSQIPTDLLWLFRNAKQTTFIPFDKEADIAMRNMRQQLITNYILLYKELINKCVTSKSNEYVYKDIREVEPYIKIDGLRIEKTQ